MTVDASTTFADVLQHVIDLASARNTEANEFSKACKEHFKSQHPEDELEDCLLAPTVGALIDAGAISHPRAAFTALHDFLEGLPFRTLRKVELLMYAGREQCLPDQLDIHQDPPDWTVDVIIGKAPLDEYLREGRALCKKKHFDLESWEPTIRNG
jgi:hypothetical protein